jgi:hypothetical protein
VKRRSLFFLPLILGSLIPLVAPQSSHHFPSPPDSMDSDSKNQPPDNPTHRIDLVQAQKEANDLARTAQTIPSDIASVRQGMLPKDVIEKLKQIEKLSKHLRNELNP